MRVIVFQDTTFEQIDAISGKPIWFQSKNDKGEIVTEAAPRVPVSSFIRKMLFSEKAKEIFADKDMMYLVELALKFPIETLKPGDAIRLGDTQWEKLVQLVRSGGGESPNVLFSAAPVVRAIESAEHVDD